MKLTEHDLEAVVDVVMDAFTSEITQLSNNEVEYVLTQLVNRFDGWLEQVREAAQREQ